MAMLKKIDMMEATRLTREGRLQEAVELLLGASVGLSAFDANVHERPLEASPPTLELLPPPTGHGSGRKFDTRHIPNVGADERRPQIPLRLSGLLDQMRQFGSATGLEGLTAPVARAPVAVPDGARFEERTYANSAGSRTYKLFVPSGCVGQAMPLVVMLHGCRQSPDDFAVGTRMNQLAEEQSFLVAYPAQSATANASRCWNWFKERDQERDQGEPSLIAGITREIMRDFNVEPARISIAGLSAGGAAAAVMGATYPDLFGAVGVHSGLACGAALDMPSAFAAMRTGARDLRRRGAVRTIVFHGDKDMTVSSVNGDQVIAQCGSATNSRISVCQGRSPEGVRYTRTVYTDESGHEMMEQWVVHGLGHAWSGGSAAGSHTDPRGPDASREMVRFFFQNRQAQSATDSG
jgi:poly(hydroxyalkanoate) depolymerase family esterase